ncbi:MAG: 2-C-methyl-D-erythritol 4-phosphate cytidylyltransferase [Planctomycetota bacterium]|jgi:2-C-methyl-D-erythritol 4-phosphate cytidylyltransferase/2-C-methyl-D-erythritol 2,4-cyclodiphosphate synthase
MPKIATVIVAAGEGTRLGAEGPKALVSLAGRPLFLHSLERLAAVEGVESQVVVVPPGHEDEVRGLLADDSERLRVSAVVAGGAERRDSAAAGFAALPGDVEVVLVHDAARPLVQPEVAKRVAEAAAEHGAALPVVPVSDTVKRADGDRVEATVPRTDLRAAQTPQGFRVDLYGRAMESSTDADTDDASMVERLGEPVVLVDGDARTLKVTTPQDLVTVEALLTGGGTRVGSGWDRHRLEEGRRFVLGGLELEHDRGPVGHSDGDVVLHAVVDAVLGAAGLGDIGEHFPPSDDRWKDADSRLFLDEALRLAADRGWAPLNADVTVLLEAPKLGTMKASIRDELAGLLGLAAGAVALKAKTGEGVGPVGEGVAVEAQAVVLMRRAPV